MIQAPRLLASEMPVVMAGEAVLLHADVPVGDAQAIGLAAVEAAFAALLADAVRLVVEAGAAAAARRPTAPMAASVVFKVVCIVLSLTLAGEPADRAFRPA